MPCRRRLAARARRSSRRPGSGQGRPRRSGQRRRGGGAQRHHLHVGFRRGRRRRRPGFGEGAQGGHRADRTGGVRPQLPRQYRRADALDDHDRRPAADHRTRSRRHRRAKRRASHGDQADAGGAWRAVRLCGHQRQRDRPHFRRLYPLFRRRRGHAGDRLLPRCGPGPASLSRRLPRRPRRRQAGGGGQDRPLGGGPGGGDDPYRRACRQRRGLRRHRRRGRGGARRHPR